jgi:hypothetical protein
MKFIKDRARVSIQHLQKKDVLVLWGGSNDAASSNSVEGMKHILGFGRNSNHTNGILMSVPHRYDFIRNSCVNNAVEAYNRRLWKRMKRSENVETNLGTERLLHKTWATSQHNRKNVNKKSLYHTENWGEKMELICMKWKNDKVSDMQEHLASQRKANVNPEGEDSEGKSKLSVTDIPEAENYSQE